MSEVALPELTAHHRLADSLFEKLNGANVPYCHWKSNFWLAGTGSQERDLDLLVERKSMGKIVAILSGLGFKPAVNELAPISFGISHYYGLDSSSGQWVHVHLFSSVLTGESFAKGHLFPFERMLLQSTENLGDIHVPAKAAELLLFTLRLFVKQGSLMDIPYLVRDWPEIMEEFLWLKSQSDVSEVLSLLQTYCPAVSPGLFGECLDALSTQGPLLRRILLARRVRKCLRTYCRFTRFSKATAMVKFLWSQRVKLVGGRRKHVLHSGGAVIAFVGPDASGKSSLVSDCRNWLDPVFPTRAIHAGRPPSTWLTSPIRIILPFIRRALPHLRTGNVELRAAARNGREQSPAIRPGVGSMAYAIRAVSVAWERRCLLMKARRLAANGVMVVCDRYPSMAGGMDSRRLAVSPGKDGFISAVLIFLARLEDRLYRQIPPPDVALKLRVSVATAKERNRDRKKAGKENDHFLEFRHQQVREWHWPGTKSVYELDTERPFADVILELRRTVWKVM